jgi:NTE family protein
MAPMKPSRPPARPAARPAARRPKRPGPAARRDIDLALQGGGSHGAFTWGVLDRLLEDDRIDIAGISGTSAGAMNAVVLAAGLMTGGRDGARTALRAFWAAVSRLSPFHRLQSGPLGGLFDGDAPWMDPWRQYAAWLARTYSPYQLNPFNLNPLRDILVDTIDFGQVRRCRSPALFVSTTHVRTGRLRIFRQHELTADVVLASACLPLLYQAVEIDGEAYWDGGYAGNPSLMPLITESPADDLLLVQINPRLRETVPTTTRDIVDRINEVTFNASLLKEMRSIGMLKKLIDDEGRPGHHYRQPTFRRIEALKVHRIDAEHTLAKLGIASQLDTGWAFLSDLHDTGYAATGHWLEHNFRHLGRRSTVDLEREFTE